MKTIYSKIFLVLLIGFSLASCQDTDLRKVYPHSTPVIESVSMTPTSFIYGDSVTVSAKVSDKETPLSTLEVKMIVNDVIVATQSIRTKGNNAAVSSTFKFPYVKYMPYSSNVEVQLTLINVEGDQTKGSISNIVVSKHPYTTLYMVMDDGTVVPLTRESDNNKFASADNLNLANSISYKIASKLNADQTIDYTGDVWASNADSINMAANENANNITTTDGTLARITKVEFDTYNFKTNVSGFPASALSINYFTDTNVAGEAFKKYSVTLTNGQKIGLIDGMEDTQIVYNMDYFDRIKTDSIRFTGPNGNYTLYYSPTRKIVYVDPADRTFPNILFACGMGLGYPSKVKPMATTSWGFDNFLQCVYFKKVADNTYSATVYFDASQASSRANFKFFETTGWGNEKQSDDYTLPNIIQSSKDHGATDGNWYAAPSASSGNYRITINLATKVVTATPVSL